MTRIKRAFNMMSQDPAKMFPTSWSDSYQHHESGREEFIVIELSLTYRINNQNVSAQTCMTR